MLNKLKDATKKASESISDFNENRIAKKEEFEELNKDNPEALFKRTSKVANIHVDSNHTLFKIVGAKKSVHNKKKSKIAGASLALATGGVSLLASGIMKTAKSVPDKVYTFDDLVEFELIEDDSQVTSGGVGRALAGGVLFGGVDAVVGGVTGKHKTKKVVDSMFIRVTVNSIDDASLIIPLITSKTKTNSNDYKKAINNAHSMLSTLNVIANNKEDIRKVEIVNQTSDSEEFDPIGEIKRYKELLDLEIITQEEFDLKKSELLDI